MRPELENRRQELHERARKDPQFRLTLYAAGNLLLNLGYGVYNLYLGTRGDTIWFCTLALFCIVMAVGRIIVIVREWGRAPRVSDWVMLRRMGFLMVTLAVLVGASALLSLTFGYTKRYSVPMLLVIGGWTGYKAVASAIRTVRAYRRQAPVFIVLRDISLADAVTSLLSLERSLTGAYSADRQAALETDAFCALMGFTLLLVLGMNMRSLGKRNLR